MELISYGKEKQFKSVLTSNTSNIQPDQVKTEPSGIQRNTAVAIKSHSL